MVTSIEKKLTVINRKLCVRYNDETIRVYQAFRGEIVDEAVKLGQFGHHFRLNRMSWIKPSFLWIMYRSGWATKKGQERVLAIDMRRSAFDFIITNAIMSSYDESIYGTHDNWKALLAQSEVRCQWDPDRDVYGKPTDRATIQLGLRGSILKSYARKWVVKIQDITDTVAQMRTAIRLQTFTRDMLPVEHEYLVEAGVKKMLGM